MKTKLNLLPTGIFLAALTTGFGQSTIRFTANYNLPENAGNATISVRRTGDTSVESSVDYATTNVSATAGLDYTATNGTLVFAVGETNQFIIVPILNDGLVEPAYETFTVTLSNPTNAVLESSPLTVVRITDNDAGVSIRLSQRLRRGISGGDTDRHRPVRRWDAPRDGGRGYDRRGRNQRSRLRGHHQYACHCPDASDGS